MTETRADRTQRIRARVERAELPAALCRFCGKPVRKGTGVRLPADTMSDFELRRQAAAVDDFRHRQGLPVLDSWRRSHSNCKPDQAAILSSITGMAVTPTEAGLVFRDYFPNLVAYVRYPCPADPYVVIQYGELDHFRNAYGWLDKADRVELREAIREARAAREPRPCQDGACAFCGVSAALRWWQSPFTWRDGTAAPLCRECSEVWERRSSPTRDDREPGFAGLHEVGVELLTGVSRWNMPDFGLRLFFEVATVAERSGFSEPWSYRSALTEVQETVWRLFPDQIPPSRSELRERIAAEHEAERRAADRTAVQAVLNDPWRKRGGDDAA
jgi:hypothetical protein